MTDWQDFSRFFDRATGFEPFPYQQRWAQSPDVPSLVSVPTGLGKTAGAVLAWLWKRRYADTETRGKTPRRLIYCLPMRVLVEQTHEAVHKWLSRLELLDFSPACPGVGLHKLLGGDTSLDWDLAPEKDQILIGTQDMLLSRALNRGYAMSRFRWPLHFGLLNNDCLWVMDEVQLMGNGLATTAQLEAFRQQLGSFGPVRSQWMSATIRSDWLTTVDFEAGQGLESLALSEDDREHAVVQQRVGAAKALEKAGFAPTKTGKAEASFAVEKHVPGTLTLVIVNTIARAQAVYQALERQKSPADRVLLHSGFRPPERGKYSRGLSPHTVYLLIHG